MCVCVVFGATTRRPFIHLVCVQRVCADIIGCVFEILFAPGNRRRCVVLCCVGGVCESGSLFVILSVQVARASHGSVHTRFTRSPVLARPAAALALRLARGQHTPQTHIRPIRLFVQRWRQAVISRSFSLSRPCEHAVCSAIILKCTEWVKDVVDDDVVGRLFNRSSARVRAKKNTDVDECAILHTYEKGNQFFPPA